MRPHHPRRVRVRRETTAECPICFRTFSLAAIAGHADNCAAKHSAREQPGKCTSRQTCKVPALINPGPYPAPPKPTSSRSNDASRAKKCTNSKGRIQNKYKIEGMQVRCSVSTTLIFFTPHVCMHAHTGGPHRGEDLCHGS